MTPRETVASNGSLDEDRSPATVLDDLSSRAETGAVTFTGTVGCTVYLHRGQFYFAGDDRTDQDLATALVRPGRLDDEDWRRALAGAGTQPSVGEQLVSNEAITSDLLGSVVLSVVYDPLIRLFGGKPDGFEFTADRVHWIGPFRTYGVEAIVNEVRRRVREVEDMIGVVPTLDAWVNVNRELPGNALQITLPREDWELLASLGESRTVSDLAEVMGRGRYSTARAVFRLAEAGLVAVAPTRQPRPTRMPPPPTPPPPPNQNRGLR